MVVDASVIVAAAVDDGPYGAWAERILAEGALVAPHLVLVEAANILRGFERARMLTKLESTSAHGDILSLDISLVPYEPFGDRIWELRGHVSAYDAWYVATAEALALPLATLDRRLGRAAAVRCKFRFPK